MAKRLEVTPWETHGSSEEMNARPIDCLNLAGNECIGKRSGNKGMKKVVNSWWNDEIEKERQERRQLNKEKRKMQYRFEAGEVNEEVCELAWKLYREQQKKVKRMIRNAKM